jgi:hypothetical protein
VGGADRVNQLPLAHLRAACRGIWQTLLHNEGAFYLKGLLLFEPRVILSSPSYQVH